MIYLRVIVALLVRCVLVVFESLPCIVCACSIASLPLLCVPAQTGSTATQKVKYCYAVGALHCYANGVHFVVVLCALVVWLHTSTRYSIEVKESNKSACTYAYSCYSLTL